MLGWADGLVGVMVGMMIRWGDDGVMVRWVDGRVG